jgi:hypothetical protein
MTSQNYEDLAIAIEHIAEGLERLALLSLDLKKQLDASISETQSAPVSSLINAH